jgi:hypothetical protein
MRGQTRHPIPRSSLSRSTSTRRLETIFRRGLLLFHHLSSQPSSAEGHAYAASHGYTLLEECQAYVIANGTLLNQRFYEGIFTRIEAAYPIDYYWIWTPEVRVD